MPIRHLAAPLILLTASVYAQAGSSVAPGSMALHDATPIRLRLMRDLTFTNIKPGEMVDFETVDDLRMDGLLLMAHGLRVTATITQAEPNLRKTHGGKLGVKLVSVPLLNGDKVAIRASSAPRSEPSEVPAGTLAGANIVLPGAPALLFTYARDEAFPEGTAITVYTDGETRIDPAGFLMDIAFTSNPPGALVLMYGAPIGRTPFTTRLSPGTYKTVFSRDGYSDLTQEIFVGPGHSNTVSGAFESK